MRSLSCSRPTAIGNHRRHAFPRLGHDFECSRYRRSFTIKRNDRHVGRVRLKEGTDSVIAPTTTTESTVTNATLYSNLNPRTLAHEPGTVWGATLLVAGTTVGAGILALPAVTQEAGFAATSGTLVGCAAFAIATGLLIAEVNMNVVARHGASNVTFTTMAEKTLGAGGALTTTLLYMFQNYALLVAYVARAGQIVSTAGNVTSLTGAAAFAVGFGGICYACTPRQFDRINGVLLGMTAATFVALLTVAGSRLDLPVLSRADWSAVPPTIPVIALAFVYHNVVPVVVHNLECDVSKVRTSIILGVLIPAAMYLLWDGAILGSLDNLAASAAVAAEAGAATAAAGGAAERDSGGGGVSSAELMAALDPLVLLQQAGSPVVAPLVEGFSFLAIATSFTGFVLAAVDFLSDAFKPLEAVPRAARYALVVLPPILLSTASPGIFFASLDFAGTYGVMTLYGMMPAAMAWASRYGGGGGGSGGGTGEPGRALKPLLPAAAATPAETAVLDKPYDGHGDGLAVVEAARLVEMLPGGPAPLLLTGAAAAAVIVSQWFI